MGRESARGRAGRAWSAHRGPAGQHLGTQRKRRNRLDRLVRAGTALMTAGQPTSRGQGDAGSVPAPRSWTTAVDGTRLRQARREHVLSRAELAGTARDQRDHAGPSGAAVQDAVPLPHARPPCSRTRRGPGIHDLAASQLTLAKRLCAAARKILPTNFVTRNGAPRNRPEHGGNNHHQPIGRCRKCHLNRLMRIGIS